MSEKTPYEQLLMLLDPKKSGDHDWFLSLLDDEKQKSYEDEHSAAVMQVLRIVRIRAHKNAIKAAKEEIAALEARSAALDEELANPDNFTDHTKLLALNTEKQQLESRLEQLMELWSELAE